MIKPTTNRAQRATFRLMELRFTPNTLQGRRQLSAPTSTRQENGYGIHERQYLQAREM